MTTIEIILTVVIILAVVVVLHKSEKAKELSNKLGLSDQILQDITNDNVQLKIKNRIYERACLHDWYKWVIVELPDVSFLVCKTTPSDEIVVIARTYKYKADDREYMKNCAEELLEKLTESL